MRNFKISHTTKFYTTLIIVMLCLLRQGCSSAFAKFSIPSASPEYLTSTSEIIVRGRIAAIEGEPYYPGGPVNKGTAHIQVDYVIKGNWDDKALYFVFPDDPLPMDNWLVVGEYGLFFLKKTNGENVPVDPHHIMLPVREGMPAPVDKTQKVLSVICDEMLFTALGPSVFSKEDQYKQREKVKIDPANMFSDPLPMNLTALNYLAKPVFESYGHVIPSNEHTANALRKLLSTENSNSIMGGAVLRTLLALGQFDVLDEAVKYIDAIQQTPAAKMSEQLYIQAGGVEMAIGYVNGAKYVPTLGGLLKSPDVQMRRSSITALTNFVYYSTPFGKPMTNLKDSVTLPFLIKALDDSDSEVRHRALRALPRATNKPSWDPPRLPTGYLDVTATRRTKINCTMEAMVERRRKQSI